MFNRFGIFECETPKAQFKKLKKSFLEHLDNTEERCMKLFNCKYGQERNFNVSYHPEIQPIYLKIINAKNLVLADVNHIIKINDPTKRLNDFIKYIKNLSELRFNLLFMEILAGKARKRLLPLVKKLEAKKLEENKLLNSAPSEEAPKKLVFG